MNKIFHSRITWYNYFYLVVLTGTALALLWEKHIIGATILLLLLVLLIERIIHTTYTITTNGQLILYHGRFSKEKKILISKIVQIERIKTLQIGKFYLTKYLFIVYDGGFVAITPVKEDEMIKYLEDRMGKVVDVPDTKESNETLK